MNQSIFKIQAEFCKAMGNETRLYVLHLLRDEPKTINQICHETGLPQSNVSRQLGILKNVGVVIAHRNGGEMVYQITDPKIGEVCDLVRSVLLEQIQKSSQALR